MTPWNDHGAANGVPSLGMLLCAAAGLGCEPLAKQTQWSMNRLSVETTAMSSAGSTGLGR